MGRFATELAAKVAHADNMPATKDLPPVSFLDTLLPKDMGVITKVPEEKAIDPRAEILVDKNYYEVKRDKKGRKVMVRHNTGHYTGDGEWAAEVQVKHHPKSPEKDEGAAPEKKGTENAKSSGDAAKKAEKKEEGGAQKPTDAPFTADEDAKLTEMKAVKTPWKEIAAEMGRPQHVLKNHWKEINKPQDGAPTASLEKKKDGAAAEKEKKYTEGNCAAEKKKAEKAAKGANPSKATGGEAKKKASKPTEAAQQHGDARAQQADENFSASEVKLLEELVGRDEEQRAMRIASRFYDMTGRRVHSQDVRGKLEMLQL